MVVIPPAIGGAVRRDAARVPQTGAHRGEGERLASAGTRHGGRPIATRRRVVAQLPTIVVPPAVQPSGRRDGATVVTAAGDDRERHAWRGRYGDRRRAAANPVAHLGRGGAQLAGAVVPPTE